MSPLTALSSPPKSVAIIGAGLGGLVLALALRKYGLQSTIYEMRDPGVGGFDVGGAIMLSPNALRVFDSLDMYETLRKNGYNFEKVTFMTDHDFATTGAYYFGYEEKYGYKALRIYRRELLKALQKAVQDRGITIKYQQKYAHIVSESDDGVTFAFADGTTATADLIVGADGIHSKVRRYLYPDIEPTYAGSIGVTYAFPKSNLRLPAGQQDFPFPVSVSGKYGAFVMAPQDDGEEIFVGRQYKYPMQDRSGWDALLKTRTELIAMHQQDMDQWSDFVNSAQEQASSSSAARTFNIWPYHVVPHMESWASQSGRVVILGDAAHAIPPTAGQGANQAAEDGFSFAILLKSLSSKLDLGRGLKVWQQYRQERIVKVMQLNDQMNITRLTEEEKRKLGKDASLTMTSEDFDLGWLFLSIIEEDMAKVISETV